MQQYQVLARKYRPKNFHELVGQTHVSKALINAIDHNRLHHAYLFTGTRGVGKTTIARILSKCLNCETGITSTPCGICSNCVAIDQGHFIDLIEIDAASRTKVEDTRDLLDNVPYAPTQGRYKVYLIDEVHMLSTHSFNALLKTLEEPPSHVKFLLATTDPQKLPVTIISRCLQFVLRPLAQQAITEHLAHLLDLENVEYTDSALWQLAHAAKGSVRDALSLTDQAISYGQGILTDTTITEMLGLIDSADLISLIQHIYNGDSNIVAQHIEQMRIQLVDAQSMFDGLAELLHQLALVQLLPQVSLNIRPEQEQKIRQLAQLINADTLQLYYQIVIQGREQIKLANTPLQALEMCLLRLLAFRPLADNEVTIARVDDSILSQNSDSAISIEDSVSESYESSPSTLYSLDNQNAIATQIDEENKFDDNSVGSRNSEEHLNVSPPLEQLSVSSGLSEFKGNESAVDTVHSNTASINVAPTSENIPPSSLTQNIDSNQSLADNTKQKETNSEDSNILVTNTDVSIDSDHSQDYQLSIDTELDNSETRDEVLSNANISSAESAKVADTERIADTKHNIEVNNKNSLTSQPNEVSEGVQVELAQSNLQTNTTTISNSDQPDDQNRLHQIDDPDIEDIDPRTLLECPKQELSGQWTPAKWDYWLHYATQSKKLQQDELAMARQGVMVGQINGKSEFVVAIDTKHMHRTFEALAYQLGLEFGESDVTIRVDSKMLTSEKNLLPKSRQQSRLRYAEKIAKQQLTNASVMQSILKNSEGGVTKIKLQDKNNII